MSSQTNRYAIVVDDLVTNVVLWNGTSEYTPDGTLVQITDESLVPGPGWGYEEGKWIAPLLPINADAS